MNQLLTLKTVEIVSRIRLNISKWTFVQIIVRRVHATTHVVPDIRAQIELFPHIVGTTADGLLLGEYRAVLGLGQTSFSARFEAPIGKGHQPGDTVRVGVQFLVPTAAIPKFPVGTRFTVWEEGRDIGVGEVIECLAHA